VADYLEVEQARRRPGLRLVLSAGVPGPWGEAAKGLFHVKRVPFVRVRQRPGLPNEALREWTGHDNAPVAVYDDERPRSAWNEILFLAERLGAGPRLVPSDASDRVLMFGLCHELAGESGLAWMRRLMIFHRVLSLPAEAVGEARGVVVRMGEKYGYDPARAEAAPQRVAEVLRLLAGRLAEQRRRESRFFIGRELTALDLYWATFAVLVSPLPESLCPMPAAIRQQYEVHDPIVRAACDPMLLEHRNFVYREYLELPIDL
jgi:glutathione S-transferase